MDSSKLDQVVKEEEDRCEAAYRLQDIARRYPDLFERAAKALLGGPNGIVASTIKSMATKALDKISTAQIVLAYVSEHADCSANDAARDVTPNITTKSNPPQKMVYATLASLERTKKIVGRVDLHGIKRYKVTPRTE